MLLRRPHDLAGLFRDGRARVGWSQNQLAEAVGVSRQWVSLVETGKTSVEFDLVVAALQALGYHLRVNTSDPATHTVRDVTDFPSGSSHEPSQRTPLTRNGQPLGRQRTRRAKRDRDE
jgi:y4mF family transcriptional regulator